MQWLSLLPLDVTAAVDTRSPARHRAGGEDRDDWEEDEDVVGGRHGATRIKCQLCWLVEAYALGSPFIAETSRPRPLVS
jgi:hypothetical protein